MALSSNHLDCCWWPWVGHLIHIRLSLAAWPNMPMSGIGHICSMGELACKHPAWVGASQALWFLISCPVDWVGIPSVAQLPFHWVCNFASAGYAGPHSNEAHSQWLHLAHCFAIPVRSNLCQGHKRIKQRALLVTRHKLHSAGIAIQ